jgi:hypothetical protein
MSAIPDLRPSPIAGTWYEGDPDRLARSIDRYLDAAKLPALDGDVTAIIAPHAGHRYSGAVAGYAFAPVRGKSFDLVVIVSPFHQFASAPLLTSAHKAYATPLGAISIDADAVQTVASFLRSDSHFVLSQVAYDREHSLEIELPFLQRALSGSFKLLPVMIGGHALDVSQALGHAIAKTIQGRNALLVASTDLSHFYDQETANDLDSEMLKRIEAFSPEAIFDAEHSGKGFACGHAAVAAILIAAGDLGADHVHVLHHATSGDVTGDMSSVVGYGAAVIVSHR